MSSTNPGNIETQNGQPDAFTLARRSKSDEENVFAADYYEILRVGPRVEQDSVERVYRTLADRFHPDNPNTGDPGIFRRLNEAYKTLSNQTLRAEYNVALQYIRGARRFWLRGREFFDGARGGQNRRLAVLCFLYRQRISTYESPGLTIPDLEQLTGCTREELASTLWYLREKNWATIGEVLDYSITVDGFDMVENKAEERLEIRTLATLSYYGSPAGLEGPARVEPSFRKRDMLSLDAGTAPTNEGDSLVAAEFDALRQSTKRPDQLHLRGREFFDGIKGEQLRRLAVLCHLYRRAAGELPKLADHKLEQLTGCTREELGSALWYVSEKKWAKSGELSEYTITAAGVDIVENKPNERKETGQSHENVEVAQEPISIENASGIAEQVTRVEDQPEAKEREAPNSWAWLAPDDSYANGLVHPHQPSAGQADEPSQQIVPVTPQPPPANASIGPEDQNSHHLAEGTHGIEDEKSSTEHVEYRVAPEEREVPDFRVGPAPESTPGNESASPQAGAAEPAAQSQPNVEVTPQSPGVSRMNYSEKVIERQAGGVAVSVEKRVILSMGGKGGVGKTSVMTGLAEWFDENQIPVTLLDLDIENKVKGSLTHFFGGRVPKINIHTPAGLDAFVDHLGEGAPVILADMGAGAGLVTHDWFEKMYPDVAETGVAFTAIGVVTSDPASVESVLNWAEALQDRVAYVIVENSLNERTDFTYWQENAQAEEFRQRFQPAIIRHDYRLADLENVARNYGVTLGRIANRTTSAAQLQKASLVMRAQSYRRRMFAEFDRVKELLLP